MADEGSADKDDLHATIVRNIEEDLDADAENRDEALDDLEFKAGNQWDPDLEAERVTDGRPCLTINRIPQFIRQVTNEARENRPAIKVRPVDDGSDVETADIYEGLVRHIEDQSEAVAKAYIPAIDNAASCGIGNWRVKTGYCDDTSFDQDLFLEGIPNAMAVVWDHLAKDPTRCDARRVTVFDDLAEDEFKAKYPNASVVGIDSGQTYNCDVTVWRGEGVVRVAEHWRKEPTKRILAKMIDGKIIDVTDISEAQRKFLPIKEQRSVDTHKVVQYIVSGAEILEGPNEWAGHWLPIVACIGEEQWIGDKRKRISLIRFAKDPQRLYNYWRSAQAEMVALQPKAPFLATAKQIGKYKNLWANANRRNLPYLIYDADPTAPGAPQRAITPQGSSGISEEVQLAADEMKATTGVYDAALGNRSNETSGLAINARKAESDVSTSHFGDNLALSIRHTGRILVDLIPSIYDNEREVRILGEDGSQEHAPINMLVMTENGPEYLHDLSVGKYDVTVTTGPSYATKRMEARDMMMQFIQTVPAAAQFVMDILAKNMDVPGADEIAKRFRLILQKTHPEMVEQKEGEEPPPPSPADQMNALAQKVELRTKTADADKAEADARLSQAQAEDAEMDAALKGIEVASAGMLFKQAAGKAVENILAEIIAGQQQQQTPQPQMQPVAPQPNAAPAQAGSF